jgi:hypothetical protein
MPGRDKRTAAPADSNTYWSSGGVSRAGEVRGNLDLGKGGDSAIATIIIAGKLTEPSLVRNQTS